MKGIPKSLVIWVPPSYMFVCYRFFNSGQPNRYKIKKQSKLTKIKVILLRKRLDMPMTLGDTQIPTDMGTPFLYVFFVIVSFIQGSQIDRRLKDKANLQTLKSFYRGKAQKWQDVGDTQSLVIWVLPSYLFVCYRFFNSGQPKIKWQSKLTKALKSFY